MISVFNEKNLLPQYTSVAGKLKIKFNAIRDKDSWSEIKPTRRRSINLICIKIKI